MLYFCYQKKRTKKNRRSGAVQHTTHRWCRFYWRKFGVNFSVIQYIVVKFATKHNILWFSCGVLRLRIPYPAPRNTRTLCSGISLILSLCMVSGCKSEGNSFMLGIRPRGERGYKTEPRLPLQEIPEHCVREFLSFYRFVWRQVANPRVILLCGDSAPRRARA